MFNKSDYNNFTDKMDKSINVLKENLAEIRAGRANPQVLDKITADYYGSPTPLNQLASIAVSEARILTIQPWDKSALKAIEKAIQASELGINPQNDGICIRLVFPPLTEERRKDLVKQTKKYGEEAKVAIRNIRRDAIDKFKKQQKSSEITEDDYKIAEKDIQKIGENAKVAIRSIRRDMIEKLKAMKKNSEITEDDLKDGEKEIQNITDSFVKEIEKIQEAKIAEILEI